MPHLWLRDDRSLFDLFGLDWVLLAIEGNPVNATADFERAAARLGIVMKVLDLSGEDAGDIYGAQLVLVRPDQIVAWRGSPGDVDPEALLLDLMGHEGAVGCAAADDASRRTAPTV